MCISNVGNRRPFPTSGFKSRGAIQDSATSASIATAALKTELNTITVSSQQQEHEQQQQQHRHHPHLIVEHHYHDHAHDDRAFYQEDHPARGGVTTPFPLKLHSVLEQVVKDGHESIISWQPHGRCFVVHDPKKLTELLPHYLKLSKLASFQRQLNLYGFQRITRGRDRNGYYHELFLKNRVFLAHSIQRIKVKGTGVRARSNPDQEPDFWSMPWVEDEVASGEMMTSHPQRRSVSRSLSVSKASPSTSASPVPSSPLQQQSNLFYTDTGLPESFLSSNFLAKDTEQEQEDEVLFGKHFFGVDQDNDIIKSAPPPPASQDLDQHLLASEVDAFFEDFDFPDDIGKEIEDDAVFGQLLVQIIS